MPEHTDTWTERLLVLHVLDRQEPVSRAEITEALDHIGPATIDAALNSLQTHGVVLVEIERISASSCTRHLDELGVICV